MVRGSSSGELPSQEWALLGACRSGLDGGRSTFTTSKVSQCEQNVRSRWPAQGIRSVAREELRTAVPYLRQGSRFLALRIQGQTFAEMSGDR